MLHLFGHRGIDSARPGTWKILILERESQIQTNAPRFFYSALLFSSHNGSYAFLHSARLVAPLPIHRSEFVGYFIPQRSIFVVHVYELLFEFSIYFKKVIRLAFHSAGKGLAICHHQSKLEENLPTSDKMFTNSDSQVGENELTVPRTSAKLILYSYVEAGQLAVTAGEKACSAM